MNNNTKKANIMTWNTYKKRFNPKLYSVRDSTFGTKSIVEPTMKGNGFHCMHIEDINESIKPLETLKDCIDIFKWTYIIYYKYKYRDFHGSAMYIFYI